MKELASTRSIRVAVLIAPLAVVWAMFRIHDAPWTGLVWVAVVLSVSLWLPKASRRSIRQVIADVDAEPVRVSVRKPAPDRRA